MNRRAAGMAVFLVAAALAGCREDMQKQPKYTPLERSWFYSDGRSARPIPAGTVAFNATENDPALTSGMVNGAYVATIPVPVTLDLLVRGRERFNIYCSPCHGLGGDGHGPIAARGFRFPANLHSAHVQNAPPGYLYQVIVKGFGAMGDYAYQIKSYRDRWAIIAYIRALELSRHATVDQVPPPDRNRLEGRP